MEVATRTVYAPALGIELEVIEGDALIGPAIESGAWEEHETRLFEAHLRPGCRVLDLGANVGWFSALAILRGAEVFAFEPVPAIAEVARRNLERAEARGTGRGTLLPFAAGDAPSTARIALGATNRGDNRVLDDGAAVPGDMGAAETVEIRIERVDDHVSGPVRVLKIDTQGSEWLALAGARELLASSPELALLVELWPYALRGASPEGLLGLLAREGFVVGKATAAPYPMTPERLLAQARARDPVKGGIDLYATRGLPFHVGGPVDRVRSLWRRVREP